MALFEIPKRRGRTQADKIAGKVNSKVKSTTVKLSGGQTLLDKIQNIVKIVNSKLGRFANEYEVVRDIETLTSYFDKYIEYGYVAIDTETTGLDPINDKIVGICMYCPGTKPIYVPINHISYITNIRLENQITEPELKEQLERLINTKIVMFNAKFDLRVIKNQVKADLQCYWDCYLGSRLLNENEPPGSKGLKPLHNKYVLGGKEDAFSFDQLFKGISFDLIPIDTAYLYAAHDSIITFELFEFQNRF